MFYRVSLRAYDNQQNDWLPADEILLSRILPYDDTQVLAKEQEEAMLYKDMRSDALRTDHTAPVQGQAAASRSHEDFDRRPAAAI